VQANRVDVEEAGYTRVFTIRVAGNEELCGWQAAPQIWSRESLNER